MGKVTRSVADALAMLPRETVLMCGRAEMRLLLSTLGCDVDSWTDDELASIRLSELQERCRDNRLQ